MVSIVENEPLVNHINEFDIILIGTNCYQVMRNGFQYEITAKFPQLKEYNYQTKYADKDKLGCFAECHLDNQPLFLLAFISFGYNFKGNNEEFIDYDALTRILKLINITYKGKSIASSFIGCTQFDGNGDKNKVLRIINDTLTDVDFTIFDYKQETGNTIKQRKYYSTHGRRKL